MSDAPSPKSSNGMRLVWSVVSRCAKLLGWGLRKSASVAMKASAGLQDRYREGRKRTTNDDAGADPQPTPHSERVETSVLQKVIGGTKRAGAFVAAFALKWGRRLADYAITVGRYYWSNGNAIKDYFIDFDPNFRPPSTTRKEIVLDADRAQPGGLWDGESWEVDLPACCVVCGKRSKVERNSEVRVVEHFRRPVWIVAACWAVGFLWAIWYFRFSYLVLGVVAGLALGHRFREFFTLRIRYQRCREHLHQTELPRLRAFGRMLIVTTGHKLVRQQFVDLAEGHDIDIGAQDIDAYATGESSPPPIDPLPIDPLPIALADTDETETPIQHQASGFETPSRPESSPEAPSDVYIRVPETPTRATPISQYYRKTLQSPENKEQESPSESHDLPEPAPSETSHLPLFDAAAEKYEQRTDTSYQPTSASGESYALQGHAAPGAKMNAGALQRSDFQRNLMLREGLAEGQPPALKKKPTLKDVLQGCFDAEHVLAEAFVSMLVFISWGLVGGAIYAAYLYRDVVLTGNEQVLAVYAVINVTLSVFFALALGWGTMYLLTVGVACVVIAFQEQILPVVARDWIQSHLTLSTLKVELIVLSTVPLLAMMAFAFLRSVSGQCGNLMWISRRAAWEEQAIQGINRPLGDLTRVLQIVIVGCFPAIAAAAVAFGVYQLTWTINDVLAHKWFRPAAITVAAFALFYIPLGLSVAGVKRTTNPIRVIAWFYRAPIDYLAGYAVALPFLLLAIVITVGVYLAVAPLELPLGRFKNPELAWWLTATVALGVIQYPLVALAHMFGLVALKNESKLNFKGQPPHG